MAKKVYAVRQGRKVGLFDDWASCKAQVDGYSGAEYKSFTTREEAMDYLEGGEANSPVAKTDVAEEMQIPNDEAVAYVDGSYDVTSNCFSYGMVIFYQGETLTFHQKYEDAELAQMRNVAGEIKGAEAAMRFAYEHQIKHLIIYHDYEGIAKWCNGAWKANKEGTKAYQAYYQSIAESVRISFQKVKGHSGDKYNDMADVLAKKALGID